MKILIYIALILTCVSLALNLMIITDIKELYEYMDTLNNLFQSILGGPGTDV